jgi:hypothetical protein
MITFALGAIAFLVFPGLTVHMLNQAGAEIGLPALPTGNAQFWVGLAVAYMVLVTSFCWEATRTREISDQAVRFLLTGKAASALVSLVYFAIALHAFAFLANFVVDGAIFAVTYLLYSQARAETRLRDRAQ